jgi:hypothetical protein
MPELRVPMSGLNLPNRLYLEALDRQLDAFGAAEPLVALLERVVQQEDLLPLLQGAALGASSGWEATGQDWSMAAGALEEVLPKSVLAGDLFPRMRSLVADAGELPTLNWRDLAAKLCETHPRTAAEGHSVVVLREHLLSAEAAFEVAEQQGALSLEGFAQLLTDLYLSQITAARLVENGSFGKVAGPRLTRGLTDVVTVELGRSDKARAQLVSRIEKVVHEGKPLSRLPPMLVLAPEAGSYAYDPETVDLTPHVTLEMTLPQCLASAMLNLLQQPTSTTFEQKKLGDAFELLQRLVRVYKTDLPQRQGALEAIHAFAFITEDLGLTSVFHRVSWAHRLASWNGSVPHG